MQIDWNKHCEQQFNTHIKLVNENPEEFKAYIEMIRCCYDKKHPKYKREGAKGIKVCPEWLNSFKTFLNDVGPAPV